MNSQGYSELPGANQKLVLTGLVNTKKPPYSERILSFGPSLYRGSRHSSFVVGLKAL